MKRIILLVTILIVGILIFSGFGVTAIVNIKIMNDKFENDNLPPDKPKINGESPIRPGTHLYTFNATDPNGDNVYYFIKWDDNTTTGWIGPFLSGQEIKLNHTYLFKGSFVLRAKAKDIYDAEGDWGELPIWISRENIMSNLLLIRFFERFNVCFLIIEKISFIFYQNHIIIK